jgi:hypothetical protein
VINALILFNFDESQRLLMPRRAATAKLVVPGSAQASTMRARRAKPWAVQCRRVQLCKVARSALDKVIDTARGSAMMGSCKQSSPKVCAYCFTSDKSLTHTTNRLLKYLEAKFAGLQPQSII